MHVESPSTMNQVHQFSSQLNSAKCRLPDYLSHSSKVVCEGSYFIINLYAKETSTLSINLCTISIRKNDPNEESVKFNTTIRKNEIRHCYELCIQLCESGSFLGTVRYNGDVIGPPDFKIICLTKGDMKNVREDLQSGSSVSYSAKLMRGTRLIKATCLVTPAELIVKKHRVFGAPGVVYICKAVPTRKVILHKEDGVFTVDNGEQCPVKLWSNDRNLIAALFNKYTLHNIGGSECFEKKQCFLYRQLREALHLDGEERETRHILVDRHRIVESAIRATSNFTLADWKKKFTIEFVGEDGIDYGGLSRAFMEDLGTAFSRNEHDCFCRLDEDQASVHPNHRNLNYTQFKFAGKIVGKCLLESALGNTFTMIHFSRAFLAQIIGLTVNYNYYTTDDPSYLRNIRYTIENDISGLFFTDPTDETAALVQGGRRMRVTEQNINHYLNMLALYRLAKRPRKQIKYFLKGLFEIIPKHLLLIFTVNELEVLICGNSDVTYQDMRAHTDVMELSAGPTLGWLWSIIEGFTNNDRAALLQFATGSSVLPPGGFKNLNPRLAISILPPDQGRLPTAHTCINQLNVLQCGSREELYRSLMRVLPERRFDLC